MVSDFPILMQTFKAIAKLVDFGNDAVQLWLQLLGREPGGSVPDGRDEVNLLVHQMCVVALRRRQESQSAAVT